MRVKSIDFCFPDRILAYPITGFHTVVDFRTALRRQPLLLLLATAISVAAPAGLSAQNFNEELKMEAGFWMGGSFPVPGTVADDILDSDLGAGAFYRMYWPDPFLLEFGFSYASYKSLSTDRLLTVPVYGAFVYPLPWIQRFSVMLKLGGGASYLEIRPANRNGWDPMLYGGFEFSILAARRFRVGLRIDGYYIYDSFRSEPEELTYLRYMQGSFDDRFYKTKEFKEYDPAFYNFGLMVSFIF